MRFHQVGINNNKATIRAKESMFPLRHTTQILQYTRFPYEISREEIILKCARFLLQT